MFYSHESTESQIRVLGKLTRDMLEHSVNVESALFRIQAIPSEEALELMQASALTYSDPEAVPRSVQKVNLKRDELQYSLEVIKIAIRSQSVSAAMQETEDWTKRFNEAIDKASDLLMKGQKNEGIDVLVNRCTQLETALVASVARLQKACTDEQSNKIEETRLLDAQRIASERKTLFWLILGGLGTGWGFILSMRRPLHAHAG